MSAMRWRASPVAGVTSRRCVRNSETPFARIIHCTVLYDSFSMPKKQADSLYLQVLLSGDLLFAITACASLLQELSHDESRSDDCRIMAGNIAFIG